MEDKYNKKITWMVTFLTFANLCLFIIFSVGSKTILDSS